MAIDDDARRKGSAEPRGPSEPGAVVSAENDTASARSGPANPVMTVAELAELLRVDRKTVYSAIAEGDIPGVRRFGRTIRISRDAVLIWLREGRVSRSRRK